MRQRTYALVAVSVGVAAVGAMCAGGLTTAAETEFRVFLPRVISQRPPADSYVFVERRAEVASGPSCLPFAIDGEEYRFEPSSGILTVRGGAPRLQPGDAGYFGSDAVFTGTAGGETRDLWRVESVPFALDDIELRWITEGDLTILLRDRAGGDEEVTLATGETVQRQWSRQSVPPGCIVTTTLAITNFGYQDRAKIVYQH